MAHCMCTARGRACACARHGALYVMVDTWAKVDAHTLTLALALSLALALALAVALAVVLTPNANPDAGAVRLLQAINRLANSLAHSLSSLTHVPSPTASMATRRSACTVPITTGSSKTARPHSASWQRQLTAPPGMRRPRARARRAPWALEQSHGRLGSAVQSRRASRTRRPSYRFRCPLTTRYDLGQTKLRMTRHADFRGRYRIVQVSKQVNRSISQ
jgi:hypothetical protein